MTFQKDIALMVKDMSEIEAKKTLATIYLKYEKIGRNNYTKDNFIADVNSQYSEHIVGKFIFGDSGSGKNE